MEETFNEKKSLFKNIQLNQRWATYCLYFISLVVFGYVLVLFRSMFFPVVLAALIASFLTVGGNWLESKGIKRSFASAIMTLVSFLTFLLVIGAIGWAVQDFLEDRENSTGSLQEKEQRLVQKITEFTGLSTERVEQIVVDQKEDGKQKLQDLLKRSAATSLSLITGLILLHIYIFLFLYLRKHFYQFGKEIVQGAKGDLNHYRKGVKESTHVTSQYLKGKCILMFVLFAAFYGAFLLIGLKSALVFAMLAAVLSWIPYIGTFFGYLMPSAYAVLMGDFQDVIWISIAYVVVQMVESYVLTPLIIGKEIDLNPFFTIFGVVLGGTIWGIPGMVVALPVLGILKVTFMEDRKFRPYGRLMAEPSQSKIDAQAKQG